LNDIDLTGHEQIEVFGAREHNLKNIDVNIPRNRLVVITGISGKGVIWRASPLMPEAL
jgi:excinuclease ABC subunit A